jgi:hypothetical protein
MSEGRLSLAKAITHPGMVLCEFDGIGDDLAADEGGFHAFGAHADAIRDHDRVEFDRSASSLANALFDAGG